MLITILQYTPTWVFVVLFGLIALGFTQSFPRSLTLRRSAVLPLVLVGLSLMGVISTFGGQPLALLLWVSGLTASVATLHGRLDTSDVRFSTAARRFQVPGSWVPLILMMALFTVKFGAGVTLASRPELRQSTTFALAASGSYGLFSGIFLARAMALWALARRALLNAAHHPQP